MAFPTFLDEEGEIAVPSLDGRSTHNIKKSYVLDIIQPRVEELIEQVGHVVDTSGYKNFPVVGVVTGGGSVMPGITEHCLSILGLKEVRRGVVQRDLITSDEQFLTRFTVPLWLLLFTRRVTRVMTITVPVRTTTAARCLANLVNLSKGWIFLVIKDVFL